MQFPNPMAFFCMPIAQTQPAIGFGLYAAQSDFRADGSAAAKFPAVGPIAHLVKRPVAIFQPRAIGLRVSVFVVFVIADHRAFLIVKTQ